MDETRRERARIGALRSYEILDSEADPTFERIVALAADVFAAPIVLVSLIDEERQWFKARFGLDACATPRDQAFCAHALALNPGEVMVVPDATIDPRFAANPLVLGPPHIRFYAGALLSDEEGFNLGTLCVIDTRPREDWDVAHSHRLQQLAALVMDQIAAGRRQRRLARRQELLSAREAELEALIAMDPDHRAAALAAEQRRVADSEARLSDLVVNALEAIVVLNEACEVEAWNRQAEITFGWRSEEAVGRPIDELIVPNELRTDDPLGLRRFMSTGEGPMIGRRVEALAQRKDGRSFPIEIAISAGRGADGWRFTALMHDITERKAEDELFENAFRYAPIGKALVGLDGRLLRVNEAFASLVDREANELRELGFQAITHPDDLHRDLELLGRLQAGEIPSYQMDKRYLRPNGDVVWATLSVSMVRDENGAPKQFIAQVQDLTERMEVEARYQIMAENTRDMIVTSDLRGRILFVSAAVQSLAGWTPEEALGRQPSEFCHKDDLPALIEAFARTATGEEDVRVRWRGWHQQRKEWIWLESSPSLLPPGDDGEVRFLDVVRDVGAQVAQEAALADAIAAAQSANLAKGEFLANMSHELRTPLNAIVGYSRLLIESDDMTGVDRRRADIVRGASETLTDLINDILDFSRLEVGAVRLEARPFLFEDLISEAISLVEPKARENAVRVSARGDAAGVVAGDRGRLRQVLLNLLSNAVKFTRDGAVQVCVETTTRDEAVALKVSVADDGVGIPADKLPLLFRRFSQANTSVTRTFGGSGLGLAISRELIELMGGSIGVKSKLGRGSTFWFEVELPRAVLENPEPSWRVDLGPATFPGRRVLVVDDVALNRELMLEMLRRHECEAELAADGQEAVERVAAGGCDLVLMDVHMPGMDGLEATRAIRAAGNTDLPILALTASGAPERVRSCLEAGMDGHLLKPLTPNALEEALAKAFGVEPAPDDTPAAVDPGADEAVRAAFEVSMGRTAAARFAGDFLADLKGRFRSEAREVLRDDAHKLAGQAGMFGLGKLGETARVLEAACQDGSELAAPLADMRREAAAAEAVIAAWTTRLAGSSE